MRLNENEPGSKTQRFFDQTRDGKLLLRKAMERHVPEGITGGAKQGFSALTRPGSAARASTTSRTA